jgi:hypothetical protein
MKTRDIIRELSHLNIDIYEDCDITHDSLQSIIDGLGMGDFCNYLIELYSVIAPDKPRLEYVEDVPAFVTERATEEQKVEAILKAKGVWK